jgi:YD repeat-containing protein
MTEIESFNYRVMRHSNGEYAIHEVYYDAQGQLVTWTLDPLSVACLSVDELRVELERYLLALDRPTVDFPPAHARGGAKD